MRLPDDGIVHARGTAMRVVRRPFNGIFRKHEFHATVALITLDGENWNEMPEYVQGRGATIAEAQANLWSRWLLHCVKNRLGNVYLTLEDPNAVDS